MLINNTQNMTIEGQVTATQRVRQQRKRSKMESVGRFRVKNTFLELTCADAYDLLSGDLPTSPAMSSPGKMQSHYTKDHYQMLARLADFDADTEEGIDGESSPNITKTPSSSTVGSSWNAYVEPGKQSWSATAAAPGQPCLQGAPQSRRPSWEAPIGEDVILAGLSANGAAFNGFLGRVTGFDHGTERYSVVLDDFFPQVTCQVNGGNLSLVRPQQVECY